MPAIMKRIGNMSNIIEWKNLLIIYKRYASLIIAFAIDRKENELMTLEVIHRYVEVLDTYFGSVCELDIIFNFEKAYFLLDELIMAGELEDTSKKAVVKYVHYADSYQKEELDSVSLIEV